MGLEFVPAPMTVEAASRFLGIRAAVLRDHIDSGEIGYEDGMITGSSLAEIRRQKADFISLREFLAAYDGSRFSSRQAADRTKYIEFLEKHRYFGIEVIPPDKVFFSVPGRDDFYIRRDDTEFLDYESRGFFEDFGVSEREKVARILTDSKGHGTTRRCVENYLAFMEDRGNIYTPSLTGFVRIVFEIPDLSIASDNDIIAAVEAAETGKTKSFLADFFTYASSRETVRYHRLALKKDESEALPAYTYEEFAHLAKILFNTGYEREHGLTKKALDNSWYAEMWMFLACHYICGWRASDICSRWVYPNLKGESNPFGVCTETLKEDILRGAIQDEVYETVAMYVIRRIEMAYNVPQKTGHGRLRSEILPELRPFFGKLTLIAEYHHLVSGEGYMKPCRIYRYRNRVDCRDFFGEEILKVTGMRHISSRRLNKSYLQGLEQAARDNGNTVLVSHVIAAYARNHADADTTVIYLRDHGLTGETAGVVLFMMMQRGVFGADLYHALLAAYPDTFKCLSARDQTLLMKKIPLSAYELETSGAVLAASEEIYGKLSQGETKVPAKALKAMLAVAQGQGKAKEEGVFCKRKALGLCCDHPLYESCIANLCPSHIFTSEGITSLIRVIRDYAEKYRKSGNIKYAAALKKCIIPAFQEILNDVIRDMPYKDRAAVRKLIKEGLDE